MKSARRRAFIERKRKKGKFFGILVKVFTPVFLILAIFVFIRISTRYWNGHDKVSVAFREANGDAAITVMDPKLDEVTTFTIPGDTQVEVARNFGTFRIKNVWQLGIDQKAGGSLLPETIRNNFLFPVFLWSESSAESLGTGNMGGILHFIFLPKTTNIPFGDRLSMGVFAFRIQDLGRSEIDLGQSQFVTKETLNDGQIGYVINGPISQRLTVYFSDNDIADENLRVNIVDATGAPGVSDNVGEILEVMGGKVVSVDKKLSAENSDCSVTGNNSEIIRKVSDLFSCRVVKGQTDFDLEIQLGQKFAARF
ncbi:MAG: hypothetical protein ABSE04_03545 [Candidatus Microgenomates bacterium]|jgi:hypothetical protein